MAANNNQVANANTQSSGDPATDSWRLFYIGKDGVPVSALHDIPLYADDSKEVLNFVCEIPRGRNAKLEICLKEPFNPIKQDIKRGKLRFVHNVPPFQGYLFNYGAFPQTWESPAFKHPETKCFGDNDPLDVCEIGEAVAKVGEVKQVKVLGVLALIDDGETDWKVICIDINDPRAKDMNDIADVDKLRPGFLHSVYEWFRTYKMPAGDPANEFAFDGATRDRAYANAVVKENYELWESLVRGDKDAKDESKTLAEAHGISLVNTKLGDKNTVSAEEAKKLLNVGEDKGIPPTVELKIPEDGSVLSFVKNQLRKNPQWTGQLADVIADVAQAAAGGDLSTSKNLAGVIVGGETKALDAEKAYVVKAEGNQYTIFIRKNAYALAGAAVVEVAGTQYSQVATAKVEGDTFSYDSGYGEQTFKKVDGVFKSS